MRTTDNRGHYYILKDRKAVPVRDPMRWAAWFEDALRTSERIVANTVLVNPPRWALIDTARLAEQAERQREMGWTPKNTIDLRMHAQRILISTVFIGIDHSFGFGAPLLFETMVFNGPLDGDQDRFANWDQAEAGHLAMRKKVEAAIAADAVMPMDQAEGGK